MKHIAAYALLVLGNAKNPDKSDLDKMFKELSIPSITVDESKIDQLLEAYKGEDFHEIVQGGLDKMTTGDDK